MFIERRAFLKLPAFAAVGTLAGIREEFEGPVTFDAFVSQVGAMAKSLIAEAAPEEENYLQQVAALAGQIDRVPDATMGQPYKGVIRSGMNYRGSGIVVVQWSMEAGLTYPAHNHPHYNAITMGLEGECRIRNFDIVGDAPELDSKKAFAVRETQNQLLTPGRVTSIMATNRDNIHTFRTESKRARGIDVMTLVGKHIGFAFVAIDEKSRNGQGICQARWSEYLAG